MQSFSRVLFLTLGSVCLLTVPLFWASLALDYKALENILIVLSGSKFVGYPIPELFGASMSDSVVSQVFRMKVFISLFFFVYSLFLIGLSSISSKKKCIKFLFGGISIPIFLLIVGFWIKFVSEDHIINSKEKHELFLATTIGLIVSILLFAYSLISKPQNKSMEYKYKPIKSKKHSNSSGDKAVKNSTISVTDLSVNVSEDVLKPSNGEALVRSDENAVEEAKLENDAIEESKDGGDSLNPVLEAGMKLSDNNALAESDENKVNETKLEIESNEESEESEKVENQSDTKVKLSSMEDLSPSEINSNTTSE